MRRSGIKIMAHLVLLIGGFISVLIAAIITGSLGFLTGTGIIVFASLAIAKLFGYIVALSYTNILIILICCGVLRGFLRYAEQYANHYIAFKLLAVFRDKIFAKLRELCPAKLETKQKGAIISMITADIEALELFYAHTMSPIGIAIVSSLTMIVFVGFFTSSWLALFMAFAYIVIGVIAPLISSRYLGALGVSYRQNLAESNGFFVDTIKGSKEIVMHNAVHEKVQTIQEYSEKLINNSKELNTKTTLFASQTGILIVVLTCLMLFFGVVLLKNGHLGFGEIVVSTVALMSSYGPVLAINALPGGLSQMFAAGDRVMNLLAEEPSVKENNEGKKINPKEINIEKVHFSYAKDVKVLSDISLRVKVGEIVGIRGASGNGKSTLLKLIMRFWDKDSGTILFDGVDVVDANIETLKEHVTLISQSTYIFNATVKENLLLAKQDATEEALIESCKKANIHDFICTLENGYDTLLGGKRGVSFSSGEAQRLGLARAFVRNSTFILLDEPTGNVDSINEGIILKSIVDNAKDKAIILVSHRESTMSIANRVYNLQNGFLSAL